MLNTVVLKFGGSSVSDNTNLNIVADIVTDYQKNNNVVVVISAQGKTTDNLLKEASQLADYPDEREMDVLVSVGEQISMSKLAILLKSHGVDAISLTGWQAGILTDSTYQNCKIKNVNPTRIEKELSHGKVVIVAGFQGIDEDSNITTLGRDGSDTSAVAIAAAVKAATCYIYTDVDGVYSADPRTNSDAVKLDAITYDEMLKLSNLGTNILNNRCIEIGKNFNVPIIVKSTFDKESKRNSY